MQISLQPAVSSKGPVGGAIDLFVASYLLLIFRREGCMVN